MTRAVFTLLLAGIAWVSLAEAGTPELILFSGFDQLQPRFGQWLREGGTLVGSATSPVGSAFHAETARSGILGADFRYGARIVLVPKDGVFPEAHLQFRISVDNR